jgi:hypothetical protein
MLLCFFLNVLVFASLLVLSPQKLFFFIFCCACTFGFGSPLLKNALWLAAGLGPA